MDAPLKQSCTFRKILKHCVLALTHHLLSICWCLFSLLFLAEDARPWIAKYSHRNRHIIVFTCYGFYLQKNNHKDRIQYCSRYIHTYSNNNINVYYSIIRIVVLFLCLKNIKRYTQTIHNENWDSPESPLLFTFEWLFCFVFWQWLYLSRKFFSRNCFKAISDENYLYFLYGTFF